jgi:hypothetical protein
MTMILVLLGMSFPAWADGKMFWREEVPPTIPYQRALILFQEGTQTLVLQSKCEIPKSGKDATALGWVVPVPAPPEVASMPADLARNLFWRMSISSRPRVTWISSFFLIGIACLLPLMLLASVFSRELHLPSWFMGHRSLIFRLSVYGGVFFILSGMLLPSMSVDRGVDVISEHRVGIYDVQVVCAATADDMISWLNANEFKFGDADRAAFDAYISRGWCFVVTKINPTPEQGEREIVSEGLAAPLVLRFPHPNPVYPLILTGTGGHETEILIYLAAQEKMLCDKRLPLRFAGPFKGKLNLLAASIEPTNFFATDDLSLPYLCKFKGALKPADMAQDLDFAPAPNQPDYQEHILRW